MSKVRNLVGRGVRLVEPGQPGSVERLTEILPANYDVRLADIGATRLPADLVDFSEVYREALVEAPAHAYGVDKVESMLNHPRLAALRPEQRAAAVLAGLEAAGVDFVDVLRDAVARDLALERFAHAKESEMQAERARNEDRVLQARSEQDSFVAEKTAEIERLRAEIRDAELRFSELQSRRRTEEQKIVEVQEHLTDAPETIPGGSPVPALGALRPSEA